MTYLDEHDPKYITIENRLREVMTELDDDFLKRIVTTDWGIDTPDSHWYDAVLQMMYAIVASSGVPVDQFFVDWVIEPHNCYLLREYKRRQNIGVYDVSVKKFDGMNKSADRGAHYGMHGITSTDK